MARYRSRRTYRRSASQSAASLLALALPAPIQRVADTRLGPLLMLIGVPTMIVAGLLQVNWSNGLPSVNFDPQAAANVLHKTEQGYNNFERQGGFQDIGHAASDFLNGIASSTQGYNNPSGYSQAYPTANPNTQARVPTASFPSTQPQSAASQHDYRYPATQPANTYAQPNYTQQQTYAQPSYTQQPTYSQSGYTQQAASPSDTRNLTSLQQQQLYQQQQYQQQLYEQQLRQQQYQQWLAQQQATGAAQPAATGYSQTDAYGRPVSTGYGQTTNNYTQPTNPYGQQNYNQGAVPNTNTHGRY